MILKYNKVYKEESDAWFLNHQDKICKTKEDKNRLHFHLMGETGWVNDPNGLCQFNGVYHIYYQYCPYDSEGTLKVWGHYTTKDFIHYKQEDITFYPDQDMDAHGVYSGSAFIEDNTIHYFYTGNVKLFDKDDYDYINAGRVANVIHVSSKDGYHFSEKELVLENKDYPKNMSNHVRDPKIYKKEDIYYMVLGARDIQSKGCILVYESKDLKKFTYHSTITTEKTFGYMWECPDVFELDGALVLISCPQGVETQGIDYENVHSVTSMILDANFTSKEYRIHDTHLLDRGFDFYAPQTFLDENGRRILIGWMGIPDAAYTNPTIAYHWQHALTLPRELHVRENKVYQMPIEELKKLRTSSKKYTIDTFNKANISREIYELEVQFKEEKESSVCFGEGVKLMYEKGILTLDLHKSGSGREKRSVKIDKVESLRVYKDTSSLEIFVNEGEEVFTTRVYMSNKEIMCIKGKGNVILHELKGFTY